MNERYYKWYSPNLSRNTEMLVFGHSGYPVILFPTSMGIFHENKDMGLIESARWYIEQGLIQIYCPDSIDKDSFYNKRIHPEHRIQNHDCYDKMLCHEIIEKVRHNTPTAKVAVAGCSFGGYHASNFAFRHPGYVSHLFCMSGIFNIKSYLDGFYNDNVFYHCPEDYLPGLQDYELQNMDIALGTSNWDICFDANLKMSHLLNQKNMNHWLDIRQNREHDWPLWKEMFPHYLSRIKFA